MANDANPYLIHIEENGVRGAVIRSNGGYGWAVRVVDGEFVYEEWEILPDDPDDPGIKRIALPPG